MTSHGRVRTRIRARLIDFLAYISIGLGFLAVLAIIANTSLSHDAFVRWGGLAVNSTILFGYFVANSRTHYKTGAFWVLTVILAVLHLAAFGLLLANMAEWKLIWFAGMVFEFPIFVFARDRLGTLTVNRRHP